MIAADEARARVDERLERIAGQSSDDRPLHDVALLCSGTDVRGPELEEEINRSRTEFVAWILRGHNAEMILNGLFTRIFWLGFEFGKAEER